VGYILDYRVPAQGTIFFLSQTKFTQKLINYPNSEAEMSLLYLLIDDELAPNWRKEDVTVDMGIECCIERLMNGEINPDQAKKEMVSMIVYANAMYKSKQLSEDANTNYKQIYTYVSDNKYDPARIKKIKIIGLDYEKKKQAEKSNRTITKYKKKDTESQKYDLNSPLFKKKPRKKKQ
jgi:hypothetical protein